MNGIYKININMIWWQIFEPQSRCENSQSRLYLVVFIINFLSKFLSQSHVTHKTCDKSRCNVALNELRFNQMGLVLSLGLDFSNKMFIFSDLRLLLFYITNLWCVSFGSLCRSKREKVSIRTFAAEYSNKKGRIETKF